jgi:hypothetical protein
VPAQALTLLNNRMVGEQAEAMAKRLARESGTDLDALVKRAWLLAYNRRAGDSEIRSALSFIAKAEADHRQSGSQDPRHSSLVEFCMGILNTTEFIYSN